MPFKIELWLPDWCKDQHLMVIAGQELAAEKYPWLEKWKVKTVRCNQCGECCMTLNTGDVPFVVDDEHKCSMLKHEDGKWLCTARQKTWVPLSCLHDPLRENAPGCCIEYEDQ